MFIVIAYDLMPKNYANNALSLNCYDVLYFLPFFVTLKLGAQGNDMFVFCKPTIVLFPQVFFLILTLHVSI